MKAKLITYNGDWPEDVTIGKVYEAEDEDFFDDGRSYNIIDDKQDEHIIDKSCFEIVNEPAKQSSDGGSTSYYQLPEGATELFDLINHRNMNFAVGNIFKACYRMGEKEGIDDIYDLKKIIFMAEQELKRLGHKDSPLSVDENGKTFLSVAEITTNPIEIGILLDNIIKNTNNNLELSKRLDETEEKVQKFIDEFRRSESKWTRNKINF